MAAFNFCTDADYTGSNAGMVGNGAYSAFATFNQVRSAGYAVNKGARGVHILCGFWDTSSKDEATGEVKTGRVAKHAVVFDIADTNALDDPAMVAYLEQRATSQTQPLQPAGSTR